MKDPHYSSGGWLRPFLKKAFIGYLIFVTGCSSTNERLQQAAVAEAYRGLSNYQTSEPDVSPASLPTTADANVRDPNSLPELGGQVTSSASHAEPTKEPLADLIGSTDNGAPTRIGSDPFKGSKTADASSFQSMAAGFLSSAASQTTKEWFSARHATAELAISAGRDGNSSGSFDLLMPVLDDSENLIFTQVGFRRSNAHTEDFRNTINLGVGYRRNFDQWLAGVNAFYDRDLTGKNDRVGLGAELFTDNIRASANTYIRLSDWQKSPDLDYYLERPANGYDLRVEANLPAYPQIGGKLIYEQYFGDEVGLFGSSDRQKDPKAFTVGLSYNPIPMVGFGVDHRMGQGGLSETSAKMSINYQFGVPLAKQLSMAYSTNHKLSNSRYGLVNRNNEIVLDYKKEQQALLMLPPEIFGTPTAVVTFPLTLTGGQVSNVTWTGTASQFALPYNGSGTASVSLPALNGSLNTYTLQAVGTDVYGQAVKSNVMNVTVTPFLITLARSKAVATADGNDEVEFTASLLEPTGEAKADTEIVWEVSGSASVLSKDSMTNKMGKANLRLVSLSSSLVSVQAKEPQGASATAEADFLGDPTSAKILSLVATPTSIIADGSSTTTLTATVVDKNGAKLGPNIPITWNATTGTLASTSSVTDANSNATVLLKSPTIIGTSTITATAVAGSANVTVNFTADNATARVLSLVAAPSTIVADGTSTSTLTATIVDGNSNLVGGGVQVAWAATDGTLSGSTSTTDASSRAVITLKSATLVGTSTVTATAAAGDATAPVVFTANLATARVSSLVATPAAIAADNSTTSSLEATVLDANGNAVPAAPVTWTTSLGTLSSSSTTTNASGKATVTLRGAVSGTASIKATAVAGPMTATVDLLADSSTAKAVTLVATPTSIAANGVESSRLVVTVKDANGNLVPSSQITWTTSLGTLSSASTATNASGTSEVTLSGTVAGSATVTARTPAGGSTAVVALNGDLNTAKVAGLTATPPSIVANNSETSTLVATVNDANGNPVVNAPVSWSSSLGTLSSASTVTNAAGRATVTLRGAVAGSASVTASAVAGALTENVTLIADSSTARVLQVVASPTSILANGTSSSTLVATVQDANGNALPASTVNWSSTSGSLSASATTTGSDSKTTVILTSSTVAGLATITASAAAGSSSAGVTFTANPATARVIGVAASPASVVANGTSFSTLSATVTDDNGNRVPGVSVSWTSTLGTLAGTSSTTGSTGVATINISSTTAGASTVTASAVAGSANGSLTFTPDAPVINSFYNENNQVFYDSNIGDQGIYHYDGISNRFRWSVTNATRYELVDVNFRNKVLYSGSGNFVDVTYQTAGQESDRNNQRSYTLRAYNGSTVTTRTITVNIRLYDYCQDNGGSCGGS